MGSSNSQGVLPKLQITQGDKLFFLKTGRHSSGFYDKLSPLSEVMACSLAKLLNIDTAEYELAILDNVVEESIGSVYVTASPCFYDENSDYGYHFTPFAKASDHLNFHSKPNHYELICQNFKSFQTDLDRMIVFDYIIDNPDRHMNNFGFVDSVEGEANFAPLFDHDQSLFSTLNEQEVESAGNRIAYDFGATAKPFNTKHSKSLSNVVSTEGLGINLELKDEDFELWAEPYGPLMSLIRHNAILKLVKRRYKHVQRKLLS